MVPEVLAVLEALVVRVALVVLLVPEDLADQPESESYSLLPIMWCGREFRIERTIIRMTPAGLANSNLRPN